MNIWMSFASLKEFSYHTTTEQFYLVWVLECAFRLPCLAKDFGQRVQLNDFSPVWSLMWILSCDESLKDLLHNKHLKCLFEWTKILSEINMSVKNYYQKCKKKWFLCLCTLIKIRNIQIQTILHKQQKWEEKLTQHFIKVCAKFVLAKYGHKFYSTANKVMFNRGEISLKILKEFTIKTVITPTITMILVTCWWLPPVYQEVE